MYLFLKADVGVGRGGHGSFRGHGRGRGLSRSAINAGKQAGEVAAHIGQHQWGTENSDGLEIHENAERINRDAILPDLAIPGEDNSIEEDDWQMKSLVAILDVYKAHYHDTALSAK